MKKMKIIMLGAPGAGKGTQAKKIAEKYTIPHISTGDIFRANIKNNTELGQKAKTYMDKGELVPDELVVDLIMDRFKEADCANDSHVQFHRQKHSTKPLPQMVKKWISQLMLKFRTKTSSTECQADVHV